MHASHLVIQLPGPEGELHAASVPRDVLSCHLAGGTGSRVRRRGPAPRGPSGSRLLTPTCNWAWGRGVEAPAAWAWSPAQGRARKGCGAGGRRGLTVMGDLPAFPPNFSSSAWVTFWATIWMSEDRGGVRSYSPGDPSPARPVSRLLCFASIHCKGLAPQIYNPGPGKDLSRFASRPHLTAPSPQPSHCPGSRCTGPAAEPVPMRTHGPGASQPGGWPVPGPPCTGPPGSAAPLTALSRPLTCPGSRTPVLLLPWGLGPGLPSSHQDPWSRADTGVWRGPSGQLSGWSVCETEAEHLHRWETRAPLQGHPLSWLADTESSGMAILPLVALRLRAETSGRGPRSEPAWLAAPSTQGCPVPKRNRFRAGEEARVACARPLAPPFQGSLPGSAIRASGLAALIAVHPASPQLTLRWPVLSRSLIPKEEAEVRDLLKVAPLRSEARHPPLWASTLMPLTALQTW